MRVRKHPMVVESSGFESLGARKNVKQMKSEQNHAEIEHPPGFAVLNADRIVIDYVDYRKPGVEKSHGYPADKVAFRREIAMNGRQVLSIMQDGTVLAGEEFASCLGELRNLCRGRLSYGVKKRVQASQDVLRPRFLTERESPRERVFLKCLFAGIILTVSTISLTIAVQQQRRK